MIQIHDIWLMPFNGYDFIPKWNFTRQRSNQRKPRDMRDMRTSIRIFDVSGDFKLLKSYRIRASIAAVLSIPLYQARS
jgi:hypothetical protein